MTLRTPKNALPEPFPARRSQKGVRRTVRLVVGVLAAGLVSPMAAQVPAAASPTALSSGVRVDTSCNGVACTSSTIANSNTTRKIATSPAGTNGTIFVAYRASDGIHVARSTDRGATFDTPVRVTTTVAEPAIAATSNAVYVAYPDGSDIKLIRGPLDGTAWNNPPVTAGGSGDVSIFGSGQNHISVESGASVGDDRIYLIDPGGTRVLRSVDGGANFASTNLSSGWVFSDVQVDPRTGDVYALVDKPSVSFYRSTDQAASFGAEVQTSASISFSVSSLTSTPSQTLLYAAGSGTNFERFLLPGGTGTTTTVLATDSSQGRSLAADTDGTVVIGLDDGTDLKFQVSADFGVSFSDPITLASGTRSIASINPVTGDLLLLYEGTGATANQIFLTVYGIDEIRDAAPAVGTLGGAPVVSSDETEAGPVAQAVTAAQELTGVASVLVRGSAVVPTTTTVSRDAGSGGALVITDEAGTTTVTVTTTSGASEALGVVAPESGEVVCEICARLAAGSVVEAWVYSEPRLTAAVRVEVDAEEGTCPFLRIPLGGPLDGGGAIEPGVHTVQLRMYTENGFEVLAFPITVGGPVPSSVPSGEGPLGTSPTALLLLVSLAGVGVLASLGLRTRRTQMDR